MAANPLACRRPPLPGAPDPRSDLLSVSLELAVPLWIERVRWWSDAEQARRARICSVEVGSHGDGILFRTTHTKTAFNALAEGLAIAAFAPGGVTFKGQHWEVPPPQTETG